MKKLGKNVVQSGDTSAICTFTICSLNSPDYVTLKYRSIYFHCPLVCAPWVWESLHTVWLHKGVFVLIVLRL
jgi:hypothetical protein